MKKTILTFVFAIAFTTLYAQTESEDGTETEQKKDSITFNQWSVEIAAGFNKPQQPMTAGYGTELISPYTVDLGVRYMFNNKFGLKVDFGYNSLTAGNNSKDFSSKYYRADIQGVANISRILNFETWTKTIGILGHTGFGLAQLTDDNTILKDNLGNFIVGITGQIKLSEKFVLTGDMTTILNARQLYAYDFKSENQERGFSGALFTGTLGLTFYLGKNEKHADWDWVTDKKEIEDKIGGLEKRIAELETLTNDSDRDGVVDYLDVEPNSIGGVMVDTKGRAVDHNNNGIPDELENYMTQKYGDPEQSALTASKESVKNMINNGYVATYFDFGKTTPTNVSTEGIDFILTFLRNNPTASVDIIGHADEIGKSKHNDKLSNDRANNVKNTLIKAKIDASRLNVIPAGEDTSVDPDPGSRKLVRRVTFRVR
ncbi:MAG TPA: OmpA family protein [Flavobacterium sp.]